MRIVALQEITADRVYEPGEELELDKAGAEQMIAVGAAKKAKLKKSASNTKAASKADGSGSGSGEPGKGPSESGAPSQAERAARILEAVPEIAKDSSLCTKSGKPTTAAIEKATGLSDVSAAERDAALDALQPGS